jgi:tRNA threonylcarbamoyladenosine biosynthesis protein TsaE
METFGRLLGTACRGGSVLFLEGTLGMGKTTLSRFLVQGLGWTGKVKSPTYTLVEQYELPSVTVHHFDLYRLSDPEELEFMGVRDLETENAIWLVEWPEKGRGFLPQQDIEVHLRAGLAEDLRDLELIGRTERGLQQVKQLSAEAGAIE